MLRITAMAATLIVINLYAADAPKSLNEILAQEERGLDDLTIEPAAQIDAAKLRFYAYRDTLCKTEEDVKATRDCFMRVLDRIIKRAREKVREAEEWREWHLKRALKDAVPT